jgi:hypothetical protein
MKIQCALLLAVMIALAGCASPRVYTDIKSGREFPSRWLTKKTTIARIESEIAAIGTNVEEEWLVEWERFRASYRAELEVWEFADEWLFDASLVGYVLLKDGRLVASIGGIREKQKEPNQPLQHNASTGSVSNFESPARRG